MRDFARKLRQEREQRAWSQAQVAELIGTTTPNVSRWERGITFPGLYFRQKLCELLERSPQELGLLEETTPPSDKGMQDQFPVSPLINSPHFWNLPLQRNPLFTGRGEVLDCLHRALKTDNDETSALPQAICGLGGMGKTQLVTEYAYRYSDEYRAIFWMCAETQTTLISNLIILAEVLKLTENEGREQHRMLEAVKDWLNRHNDWLLILDNIEEFSVLHEFIPFKSNGHIVMTTQSQFTGSFIQRIDLEEMEAEEGAIFLLRRAKRIGPTDSLKRASPSDRIVAVKLAHMLGGLPLALDQAGAYIEEAACSLQSYLDHFQSRRYALLNLRNLSGGANVDHPHSASATFALSFERIKKNHPAAIDLLYLCAFLHPDMIPEELFTNGVTNLSPHLQELATNSMKFDIAIAELRKYSLLYRDPNTQILTIHRLVQAVLKDGLDEAAQFRWAKLAVQMVNRMFPPVENWVAWEIASRYQRYIPHVQVCAALIEEWDIVCVEAGRLLTLLAYYFYEMAEYRKGEPLLKKARDILTRVLGPEHADIAEVEQILGWYYTELGEYTKAEECYQQALAIHERMPKPNLRSISGCLADLAEVHESQGKYELAELLYQRALGIDEGPWGSDYLDVAIDLRNLGMHYFYRGRYSQAESFMQRALEIRQKILGVEHVTTAGSLNELAGLYLKQGRHMQVEPLARQALAIRQKHLTAGHPQIAASLHLLGQFYLEQGQYSQAETFLRQALAIRENVQGSEHPETAFILHDLAVLCRTRGEYAEATRHLQQVFVIRRKVLGSDHPQTIQLLHDLAELYAVQGIHVNIPQLLLLALNSPHAS